MIEANNEKIKNNKNAVSYNRQGFTLIEILLSMAILTMIITGVTVFSIQTIEAHTKSRAMQNGIENARFAIEGMSKRIRTSHSITSSGGTGTSISVTDNVSGNPYKYSFSGGKLLEDGQALVGGTNNINVKGDFYVVKSETTGSTTDNRRGFVRISITIRYDNGSGDPMESDSVTIQSGVSLRDYGQDGS